MLKNFVTLLLGGRPLHLLSPPRHLGHDILFSLNSWIHLHAPKLFDLRLEHRRCKGLVHAIVIVVIRARCFRVVHVSRSLTTRAQSRRKKPLSHFI